MCLYSCLSWELRFPTILRSIYYRQVMSETSVRNHHYTTLRNIPEEDSFHLLRGGSLKSFLSYQVCKVHASCFILIYGLSGSFIFFHLSNKRHDFREEKRVLNKRLYLDFLRNFFSEKFLILRITEFDIIVNVNKCSCHVSVFLVRF